MPMGTLEKKEGHKKRKKRCFGHKTAQTVCSFLRGEEEKPQIAPMAQIGLGRKRPAAAGKLHVETAE